MILMTAFGNNALNQNRGKYVQSLALTKTIKGKYQKGNQLGAAGAAPGTPIMPCAVLNKFDGGVAVR